MKKVIMLLSVMLASYCSLVSANEDEGKPPTEPHLSSSIDQTEEGLTQEEVSWVKKLHAWYLEKKDHYLASTEESTTPITTTDQTEVSTE